MRRLFSVALTSALLALAGCGSGSGEDSGDDSSSAPSTEGSTAQTVASGESVDWSGPNDDGEEARWTVRLEGVECGLSLTVPADAYTEEYSGRDGEKIDPPEGSQYCLAEVGLTNKSELPQGQSPKPGNAVMANGEFAPDYDLEIFLADFYEAGDSTGFFMDDPVQPGETTSAFQLYTVDSEATVKSIAFPDGDSSLVLQR